MASMKQSVVVLALFATACEFGSPRARPGEPDADAGIDAPSDAPPGDTANPGPWLSPWTHRKAITLRASQIEAPGDGALTDFPVLISVNDPDIRASAAFPTGQDIVFTAADATTLLASEIESFDRTQSDQLVAWVKVPSLSATTDTTLYVYYGNPSAPAQTPEAVWTADYLAVWHLHQDPGGGPGSLRDATSGNHDGTATQLSSNDSVPARIGRGLQFNGNDEYLDFQSLSFGNNFTISMWVQFDGGTSCKTLFSNSGPGPNTDGFRFFVNTFNTQNRRIIFETGNGVGPMGNIAETADNGMPEDTLTHVAAVVNRTAGTAQIFVNAVGVATDTMIRNNFQTTSDFEIARMEAPDNNFPGIFDEVRVASTLRGPEWILTSFRNQSAPGNFHTLGDEELRP